MRKELTALREKMKHHGFDAYIIPTTDFHSSEYVHDHFKFREYVSGFTGSAGTLVVTMEDACLWTDGRYFLQADAQLARTGIRLMKINQPGVPTIVEYLKEFLLHDPTESAASEKVLAFDGRLCTVNDIPEDTFNMMIDCDLADEIWHERPQITPSEIYSLDISVTGEPYGSKINRLRKLMDEKGADYYITVCLDEIAWLYNLRGSDIKHTPVFFSYTLITPEENRLYIMDEKGIEMPGVSTINYDSFLKDLNRLPHGKLLLDKSSVSYAVLKSLPEHIEIIDDESPVAAMKSIKNEAEIQSTKNAHIRDGAAMAEFICFMKNTSSETEISAADKLETLRRRRHGFKDLSFDTISGYGGNGAVIHYCASRDSDRAINSEGLYLVDSGGQYEDGTTDITRTIVMGPLTENMKLHYTAVLKGHIALCMARFKPGTTGAELDAIARRPLQEIGLDYNHGTGHGVGHILSCHEGPQAISPRDDIHPILPGMINSNEPGVYIEGQYGIRLENELLCVKIEEELYGFEPITLCPFDRDAILPERLTKDEIAWLNDYHAAVYKKISPLLNESLKKWLCEATKEIR